MHTAQNFQESANSRNKYTSVLERLAQVTARLTPRPFAEVILPAGPALTQHRYHSSSLALSFTSRNARGDAIRLQRDYCPDASAYFGIWYGSETRKDSAGREWRGELPHHVVDDFGNLVAVAA